MGINVGETLMGLVTTSGIYQYLTNPLALIMVAIACVLLYLAIVKQFEPLLLLPIAFGMLLTNLLGSDIFHEELFAGGHANWALFGGAVLIDGKDFVDSVGYMVNAAGQILTSNNVVLGHFVNAVTIDDPTKLVPFADILAQFAANGNAASIILEDAFLKKGILLIVDGTDPELVRAIMETELVSMDDRHKARIGFWENVGSMGPAWGMIGTLVGLVNMLNNMDDAAAIGPGMATALITTLYGSLLANMICTPVANKLKTHNALEMMQKEIMIEGLLSIQAGENPRVIEEKLKSFMAPIDRMTGNEDGGEEIG